MLVGHDFFLLSRVVGGWSRSGPGPATANPDLPPSRRSER